MSLGKYDRYIKGDCFIYNITFLNRHVYAVNVKALHTRLKDFNGLTVVFFCTEHQTKENKSSSNGFVDLNHHTSKIVS